MKNFKKLTMKKIAAMTLGLSLALSTFTPFIPASSSVASAASTVSGSQIIKEGEKYLGVKYKLGGKTPSAFDCQGFTRYVFNKYGIQLPAGARNQSKVGKPVSKNNLKVGDLVFFSTSLTKKKYSASSIKRIGHVGIYAGNGKILHTYGKGGVKYSNLNSKWWSTHYVKATRVIDQPAQKNNKSLALTSQAKTEVKLLQDLMKKNGYKTYSQPNDWLKKGKTISQSSIKRGDIAFVTMDKNKSSIEHAAVYLGNGQLLYKTKNGTQKYKLKSKFVQDRLVTIKRVA